MSEQQVETTESDTAEDAEAQELLSDAADDTSSAEASEQNTGDLGDLSSDQLARMVRKLRKENGADRTSAKQSAAQEARDEMARSIGKALGLVKDDETVDPDKLRGEIASAQQEARANKVENAVLKSAGKHNADATRLTDSRAFMSALEALDPAADDFGSQVDDAIKVAISENPAFKVGKPTQRYDVGNLKPGASPNDPANSDDALYRQFYPKPS